MISLLCWLQGVPTLAAHPNGICFAHVHDTTVNSPHHGRGIPERWGPPTAEGSGASGQVGGWSLSPISSPRSSCWLCSLPPGLSR